MKPATLAIIVVIAGAILGMMFISDHYRNEQLKADEKERKGKDVLQIIIDSTQNKDPFFNNSLKGKVVVISVWSPSSAICRKQIPDLNKLEKDFASDKTVFVALDAGDSAKDIEQMKTQNIKFDYQLLFGKYQLLRVIYSMGLVQYTFGPPFPINMILNPDGGVEMIYTGNNNAEDQMENMRNYLSTATGKM
jgi:thiol-disulfide isomerase/thioredoxin